MVERIIGIIVAIMVILGFVCFFGILLGTGSLDWWIPATYITEISLGVLIIIASIFK
jgi:hypothetical protein